MNISILDAYVTNPGDLSWQPLSDLGTLTVYDRTSREELAVRTQDADIAVSNKIVWDKAALDAAPNLKMIALTSTGFNTVDLEEADRRGIVVSNVPAYATPDVVQMVFALIFELCYHMSDHIQGVHKGRWIESKDFSYWDYPLVEINKKTLGIVGMGSIGQSVATVAQAFGMQVLFYNRSARPEYETLRCHQVDFDEVLARSDFLTLHVPATPETEELINKKTLEKMKQGAYLINTGRGTLLNEEDVADALKSGKLAGAGLDVVAHEPMWPDNPLRLAPNTAITPHIAWAAKEARARLLDTVFANVRAFVEGRPQNVVGL